MEAKRGRGGLIKGDNSISMCMLRTALPDKLGAAIEPVSPRVEPEQEYHKQEYLMKVTREQ